MLKLIQKLFISSMLKLIQKPLIRCATVLKFLHLMCIHFMLKGNYVNVDCSKFPAVVPTISDVSNAVLVFQATKGQFV